MTLPQNFTAQVTLQDTDRLPFVRDEGSETSWSDAYIKVSDFLNPSSGTFGFWDRTSTTISPDNSGDTISTDGDIKINTDSKLLTVGSGDEWTHTYNSTDIITTFSDQWRIQGTDGADNGSGSGTSADTLRFEPGDGGDGSGSSSVIAGGSGGALFFTGGAGGTASGGTVFSLGGKGSENFFNSGNGGDSLAGTPSTSSAGGAGGRFVFTGGDGGDDFTTGSATPTGGAGGDVNFGAGDGGSSTSDASSVGGEGGVVNFVAGSGGIGTAANGLNGTIKLTVDDVNTSSDIVVGTFFVDATNSGFQQDDDIKTFYGTGYDGSIGHTGSVLEIKSDNITATDSLLLRGGTNGIDFNIGSTEQMSLTDGVLFPTTDSDVDLGKTDKRYKDAYIDSATVTGAVTAEQLTSTDDITMQGHLLTLGDDTATDIVIDFKGSANDGSITFDESAGEFDFGSSDITTTGTVDADSFDSNVAVTDNQTNGDFATGDFTGWTAGADWSVVSNKAEISTTAGSPGDAGSTLTSSFTPTVGKLYKISFDWTVGGGLVPNLDVNFGGKDIFTQSGAGSGSETIFVIPTTTDKLTFIGYEIVFGTMTGDIDNVTIEEANDAYVTGTFANTVYRDGSITGDFLNLDVGELGYSGTIGFDLIPATGNIYDLGSTSARWAEGYITDIYVSGIYAFDNKKSLTVTSGRVWGNPSSENIDFRWDGQNESNIFLIDASEDDIQLRTDMRFKNDGDKILMGAGDDVSIEFDGSDMVIASENVTANDELLITGFTRTSFDAPVKLPGYTVATLPAGAQGDTAFVTDATAPTYLGTLTGGGAVVCPVFYDGTNWISH